MTWLAEYLEEKNEETEQAERYAYWARKDAEEVEFDACRLAFLRQFIRPVKKDRLPIPYGSTPGWIPVPNTPEPKSRINLYVSAIILSPVLCIGIPLAMYYLMKL